MMYHGVHDIQYATSCTEPTEDCNLDVGGHVSVLSHIHFDCAIEQPNLQVYGMWEEEEAGVPGENLRSEL